MITDGESFDHALCNRSLRFSVIFAVSPEPVWSRFIYSTLAPLSRYHHVPRSQLKSIIWHWTIQVRQSNSILLFKEDFNFSNFYLREIKKNLKDQTNVLIEQFNGFKVRLVIIQVGGRDDSNVYIRQKIKSAAEVGMEATHVQYPKTITQNEVWIIFIRINWFILT